MGGWADGRMGDWPAGERPAGALRVHHRSGIDQESATHRPGVDDPGVGADYFE